jgi:predicted flap endonuclease-1-like 5' DNA nuclease
MDSAIAALFGAIVLTGVASLLWAMGGCFRFVGFLAVLVVASFGVGAVLVPWLNRRPAGDDAGSRTGSVGAPPSGPSPAGMVSPMPGHAADVATGTTVDTDVAAPSDYVTAQDVVASQEAAAADTEPQLRTTPAAPDAPQIPAHPVEEPVDLDVGQPSDYVTAQDVIAAQEEGESALPGDEVSFTRIKGIGPAFDRRLKDAGIRTFAQLAETPVERIAEILGWPVERVQRNDLPGQARHFAGQG